MDDCVCVPSRIHTSSTWGWNDTRMHYGKKACQQKQHDALGNVLLGNLGSWHSCGCYFDTYQLPKHSCRGEDSLLANGISWWQWILSRIMSPTTVQRLFRNSLRKMTEFKVLPWPPNSPDVNTIDHLWDVEKQLSNLSSMEALPAADILVPGTQRVYISTGQSWFGSTCGAHTILRRWF